MRGSTVLETAVGIPIPAPDGQQSKMYKSPQNSGIIMTTIWVYISSDYFPYTIYDFHAFLLKWDHDS